jgi:hypothetical protein
MFVFGEDVNGKVYGNPFDFNNLDKNKDFIHQYDYRSIYDEVLSKWLGSSTPTTIQILGKRFDSIETGILAKRSSVLLYNQPEKPSSIYPNPTIDGRLILNTCIERNELFSLNQVDDLGRKYPILQNIQIGNGQIEFPVQLFGKSGVHTLEVLKGDKKETLRVVWV